MSFSNGLNTSKSSRPSPCSACSLSGWSLWEYVVFCISIWWISFFCMLTLTRQSKEWNCRLLTLLHGSFVSYSVLRDIIANGNQMTFESSPLSDEQKAYLSFMLSYFIFDFSWIRLFGNESWIIQIHHISSILVITKVMVSDHGGLGVLYGVVGLEITNPYLQIRWFLRTLGYLNKPIHTAVELWFFFLFFLIRLFGGSILLYYMYPDMDRIMKFLGASIYLISLAFAWDISKYVKKKYWSDRSQMDSYPETGRVTSREHPKSEAHGQPMKSDGEDQSKGKSEEHQKEEGEDSSRTGSKYLASSASGKQSMTESKDLASSGSGKQSMTESKDLASSGSGKQSMTESKNLASSGSGKQSMTESKDLASSGSGKQSKTVSKDLATSGSEIQSRTQSKDLATSESQKQSRTESVYLATSRSEKQSRTESKDLTTSGSKKQMRADSKNLAISKTEESSKAESENKSMSEKEDQAKADIQEQSKTDDKEEMLMSPGNQTVKNFDRLSGDEEIFFTQFDKTTSWTPSQLSQENVSENANQ